MSRQVQAEDAGPAATPTPTAAARASSTPSATAAAARRTSAAPTSSASPTATPVPAPTPTAAPGDLDTGSTTHKAAAGSNQLVVDYWTTQSPATWTASTQAIVQLSAHLEGTGVAQKTLVTGFTVTGIGADGSRVELTKDTGSSAITRGFSYGNAFVMPRSATGARRTSVTLQWDLLTETYKGSGQFYRQTVIDTLDLALAAPAALTPSSSSSSTSAAR